jgi:hypothetical protein
MPILFNDPNSKFSPQLLTAIGTGLLSGNTWADQLANAGLGANQAVAAQVEKQKADAEKNQTVAALQPYPDLANAVSIGAMTPALAYGEMMKRKQAEAEDKKPKYQVINGKLIQTNAPEGIKVAGDFSDPNANLPSSVKEDMWWNKNTDAWTQHLQRVREEQAAKGGDVNTTTFQKDMMAAGLKPGTPEWNQAIIAHYKKSGMTIESDGKGGFRLVQGDINTPQKLTEDQSKNIGWLERGTAANKELDDVGGELTNIGGYTADQLGVAGNYFKTATYQKADRAGKDFLAVILRKDSGGAITPDEIATYGKIYLPQPGDDPNTLKAKSDARKTILDSIKAGLGGAADQTRTNPDAQTPAATDMQTKQPASLDIGQKATTTLQNGKSVTIERTN